MTAAFRRLALVAGFLPVAFSALRADDASDVVRKMERKYAAIHDVRIAFRQHVKFGVTEAEQSFEGTLVMKKGNRYRIVLEDQTIVTDGSTVWSYTKANKQVIIDKYRDDPASFTPDKLLVNVPDRYTSALIGKEKVGGRETSILKMIPKDSKSSAQWLKLWVDEQEWTMRQVQVLDISDNLTTYLVDTLSLDQGVSDSLFRFSPPPGVEVIDLR